MSSSPNGASQIVRRGVLLAALSSCSFVMPLSLFLLSPLLVDLSREFAVTVAEAGRLVTFTALPSAALAPLIGPLSDHLGRRPLLVGGTFLLALTSLTAALSPSYELLAASRVAAGLGFAAMGPSIFAAVGDLFPYRERGRAYAWTVGANTLSMILGIPMATALAAAAHWRWSFAAVGLTTAIATLVLALLYRPAALPAADGRRRAAAPATARLAADLVRSYRQGYLTVVRTGSALAVFGSSFSMSVGLLAFETYLGALLIVRYGLGTGDLAPVLAAGGLGTLVGSQIGGRLGDRIGHKPIMALSVLASAFVTLALAYWTVEFALVAVLNFLRSAPLGMRFTSASAIISEAAPAARATVQALNQSSFNFGVMVAALLGGLVVETVGYSHLALMTLAGAIVSASLIARFVVEHRARAEEEETGAATAPLVAGPG